MDELLRRLSQVPLAGRTLDEVLTDITHIAASGIPGADATSITLIRDDEAYTAAYSDPMAIDADELQYEKGYGPCMDAARANVVLRVDDMADEKRWPDYAPRVLATGVRSSLSIPLPYQNLGIGALNNYSRTPNAFTSDESVDAALEIAEAVAIAVLNADAHARLGDETRHMRHAMESRAVVEQAKGVLMAQRRIDAEQAFDLLREMSQDDDRTLRQVATRIVDAAVEGR